MKESILPTKEHTEHRAYDLYLERGAGNGRDLDDWFAAEKELNEMSERSVSSAPEVFSASARTSAREEAAGDEVRKPESRFYKG